MKRILKNLLLCGMAALAGSLAAADPADLRIGDPAPSIASAAWIKGTPVKAFQKGQVYVVEFWATWCGPCKENIPHLTSLAKAYKGKATVLGINIWESQKEGGGNTLPRVKAFVKAQGARMGYRVAADGPDAAIANGWMKAAGENGIPCSFLVDREGRVAWIGHPEAMKAALDEVLAGSYDIASARARRETEMEITRPIGVAMAAKDYPRAVKVIEAAMEKRPKLKYSLAYQHLVALYHADLDRGIKVSRGILEESNHEQGAYYMMMAVFAVETDLSPAAYEFGKSIAKEVETRGLGNYMFTAMKAELYAHSGAPKEALAFCEEALAAAEKDPHATPANLKLIRKNLAKLKEIQ
ncbi:TlpA disulfide reductase family protein [Mesoterricola silvestris]|uniref:Alkyl hydroperoxide reductase n=1 Tax=Mesoterricola silvestris TaxID=2927979 RepID=A0AA48KA70_9BACT|nr:TlpA disulfide reductase family protein [Mesoterricola silvestris]BDU74719.1 alkyl hydroperoxide reductase [Mesoterricola silvestris]